jgi:hypothetical protein
VPIKAKPLKRQLEFIRNRADVEQGIQGECGTCANAIGAVRNGLALLAQFTDSRVILVDKINKMGVPTEGFIGVHRQGNFQRKFDKNKKALLRSEECEGIVKIEPFDEKRGRRRSSPGASAKRGPSTAVQQKRERGAAARAQRAGIVYAA